MIEWRLYYAQLDLTLESEELRGCHSVGHVMRRRYHLSFRNWIPSKIGRTCTSLLFVHCRGAHPRSPPSGSQAEVQSSDAVAWQLKSRDTCVWKLSRHVLMLRCVSFSTLCFKIIQIYIKSYYIFVSYIWISYSSKAADYNQLIGMTKIGGFDTSNIWTCWQDEVGGCAAESLAQAWADESGSQIFWMYLRSAVERPTVKWTNNVLFHDFQNYEYSLFFF